MFPGGANDIDATIITSLSNLHFTRTIHLPKFAQPLHDVGSMKHQRCRTDNHDIPCACRRRNWPHNTATVGRVPLQLTCAWSVCGRSKPTMIRSAAELQRISFAASRTDCGQVLLLAVPASVVQCRTSFVPSGQELASLALLARFHLALGTRTDAPLKCVAGVGALLIALALGFAAVTWGPCIKLTNPKAAPAGKYAPVEKASAKQSKLVGAQQKAQLSPEIPSEPPSMWRGMVRQCPAPQLCLLHFCVPCAAAVATSSFQRVRGKYV